MEAIAGALPQPAPMLAQDFLVRKSGACRAATQTADRHGSTALPPRHGDADLL